MNVLQIFMCQINGLIASIWMIISVLLGDSVA